MRLNMLHRRNRVGHDDEIGRVTDRLQLDADLMARVMHDVLRDTDRENHRARLLSHEVTTWVLLSMSVLTDLPIRSVY